MRRTTSVAAPVAHLVGPGQLKVINGHLAFATRGEPALRLEPTALETVFCYGEVSVTAPAMTLLFQHGVQTAFLSAAGQRCRGRLSRSDPPTTLTRVRQHRAFAVPEARLAWARLVVAGKLEAMSQTARHHQRHGCLPAGAVLALIDDLTARLPAASIDEVRGLEGAASAAWFRLLGQLLASPWQFEQRNRRPPRDPVNGLLSLGYTWLLTRTNARAEALGYEIYLGGLHEYRAGRPSLGCDLIEPLRVPAVDRWVLAVCNRGERSPGDFETEENDGVRLRPAVFGDTLRSWESHWVNERMDATLDAWLMRLDQLLRQCTPADAPGDESVDL